MYYIEKEALAFLDGYLRGLSVLVRTQKDVNMGCGILDIQDDCIKRTFEDLFFSELTIQEYNQNLVDFDFVEKKIRKILDMIISSNNVSDIDYLVWEFTEYLLNVVCTTDEDSKGYSFSKIYEINLKFHETGSNWYFAFPVDNKFFFILFRGLDNLFITD